MVAGEPKRRFRGFFGRRKGVETEQLAAEDSAAERSGTPLAQSPYASAADPTDKATDTPDAVGEGVDAVKRGRRLKALDNELDSEFLVRFRSAPLSDGM